MRPSLIIVAVAALAAAPASSAPAAAADRPLAARSTSGDPGPAAPGLPLPPAACATPLVHGNPLDAGSDLHLSPAPDHFQPGVGDDLAQTFVFGEGGDDCLRGSPAYDRLDGGTGDDRLVGGARSDTLLGGPGDDTLLTGDETEGPALSGLEAIRGGPGNDTALPGPGHTGIALGPGDDRVIGTDGSAGTIDCGSGDDTVLADADDRLTGCEHVRRRPPLRVRVRLLDGGATLRLRAPWGVRAGGDLLGWRATLTPPRSGCARLRTADVSRGRRVVLRLRPARGTPACAGRWRARIEAVFADDPGAECDGGDCGVAVAVVVPRVSFVLLRRR